MKKLMFSLLALVAMITVVSCAKVQQQKVTSTTKDFISAVTALDADKMAALSTGNALEEINTMKKLLDTPIIGEKAKAELSKLGANYSKLQIGEPKINGDVAEVTLAGGEASGKLTLKKVSGKWLISDFAQKN